MFELFIGFLGTLVGVFLAYRIPEELNPGKMWFIYFRYMLLFGSLMLAFFSSLLIGFFGLLFVMLFLFLQKKKFWIAETFGLLVFFLHFFIKNNIYILSSLFFIYTLLSGTLWWMTLKLQ